MMFYISKVSIIVKSVSEPVNAEYLLSCVNSIMYLLLTSCTHRVKNCKTHNNEN